MLVEDLAPLLEQVRWNGAGFEAQCPAHEDRMASLSVNPGREGILLHCHAGCSFSAILVALDLVPKQMFYSTETAPDNATVDRAFRELVARNTAPKLWPPPLVRLEDVMWATFEDQTDLHHFVLAGIQYPVLMASSFNAAMHFAGVVRDGPLWVVLQPYWRSLRHERRDWHVIQRFAMKALHRTHREQGALL